MKPTYTPDRTGSTVLILLAIAAVVIGVAAVFGLSDKPEVASIVIAPADQAESAIAAAAAMSQASGGADLSEAASSPATGFGAELDDADPDDGDPDSAGGAATTDDDANADADDQQTPTGTVILIPTEVPEPTATPEIAAAVQPTPVPAQGDPAGDGADDATDEAAATLAMPSVAGTIEGSFFTRGDENEGAEVTQNVITLRFDDDGSGDFQGVLDITYPDGVHIVLNMSGPLELLPTNPQVEADLTGTYKLDSPLDTDDVSETTAELSISSLVSGSGSLCASKCFGFNFPGQQP